MKSYVQKYLNYFGYGEQDYIPCEICSKKVSDVHHIISRSRDMSLLNVIENLMGLCRTCHQKFGDKEQYMDWLTKLHLEFMKNKDVR